MGLPRFVRAVRNSDMSRQSAFAFQMFVICQKSTHKGVHKKQPAAPRSPDLTSICAAPHTPRLLAVSSASSAKLSLNSKDGVACCLQQLERAGVLTHGTKPQRDVAAGHSVCHPGQRHTDHPTGVQRLGRAPTASSVQTPVVTRTVPMMSSNWEVGLFKCFSVPAHCYMALIFPCVNSAYAARGVGKSALPVGLSPLCYILGSIVFACVSTEYTSNPDGSYDHESLRDHEEFDKYHGVSATCFLLFAISVTMLRHQMRKFHRIRGSDLEDFCVSLWCSCCVVAQMLIHTHKASLKRLADTATLPVYSSA